MLLAFLLGYICTNERGNHAGAVIPEHADDTPFLRQEFNF